jgi:hypothetical protein
MQGYANVGDVVGTPDDRGSIRENLNPSTDAGQALIVAGVGVLILLFTIAKPAQGLGRKAMVMGEFILVVGAASAVAHYVARTWTLSHPEAPGAVGVFFNF